jgi:hypothetical protein
VLAVLVALAAACTGSATDARRDLTELNAAFGVLAGEAATLQPAAYADLQRRLGDLQASFDRGDYRSVAAAAPPLRAALDALHRRLVADQAAARAAQQAEWAVYASRLPDQFAALERRVDALAAARHPAKPVIDAGSAQQAVRAAVALWSKGQSAFAAGNLGEALQVARDVQARADALAAGLPPPGPAPAARKP